MPMESIKNWWNSPGASFTDPRVQALFGASSALMEAGRPGTRNSLGSAMGQGLQGAMGGYQQGLQNQYMLSRTKENDLELRKKQLQLDLLNDNDGYGNPTQSGTPQSQLQYQPSQGGSNSGTLSTGQNPAINVTAPPQFNITPDMMARARILGVDLSDAANLQNLGGVRIGQNVLRNGKRVGMYPDVSQNMMIDQSGQQVLNPGADTALFKQANAQQFGKESASAPYDIKTTIGDQGQEVYTNKENILRQLAGGVTPQASLAPGIAAGANEARKLQSTAKFNLPKIERSIGQTINDIDGLLTHKGFKQAVGMSSMTGIQHIPGTKAKDFMLRHEQVTGQNFLSMYETLKGAGQITEIEGEKATNAISRMNNSSTEEGYREAANELKGVLKNVMNVARTQAGGSATTEQPANKGWTVRSAQ